jgi:hypothetical protein
MANNSGLPTPFHLPAISRRRTLRKRSPSSSPSHRLRRRKYGLTLFLAGPAAAGRARTPLTPQLRERAARIMNVSKPYSATCHHKYWSARNADTASKALLKSVFLAEVSA